MRTHDSSWVQRYSVVWKTKNKFRDAEKKKEVITMAAKKKAVKKVAKKAVKKAVKKTVKKGKK